MMLKIKHQGSRPCRFLQEDCLRVPYITLYQSDKQQIIPHYYNKSK